MNIETLVKQAQNGSTAAVEQVFETFTGLRKKAAGQPHIRCIYEDALAEANLSFLEAIRQYDADSGVPFAGYAKAKVYGDLRTLFKQERRNWQRETSANAAVNDEQEVIDTIAAPQCFEDHTVGSLGLRDALAKLSAKQRDVVVCTFLQDQTQTQAADQLHASQQAIAARQKRALQILREELEK